MCAFRRFLLLILAFTLTAVYQAQAQARPKLAPRLSVSELNGVAVRLAIKIRNTQSLSNATVEVIRRGEVGALFIVQNPQHTFALVDQNLPPGTYRYRARLINKRGASPWSRARRLRIRQPSEDTSPPPSIPGKPALPAGMRECGDGALYAAAYDHVGQLRATAGVPALGYEQQLYFSALAHSIWMATSQQLSHDRFVDHVLAYAVPGSSFGQNLAGYHQDPVAAVEAWNGSPSHQFNMLNPRWTRSAIACVIDLNGYYWWTQHFAR